MNSAVKLVPTQEGDELADPTQFRSIVGAMHYAAHCTQPDVAHSVAELSTHLVKPNSTHMQQARKCLSYLLASHEIGVLLHTQSPQRPKRPENSVTAWNHYWLCGRLLR